MERSQYQPRVGEVAVITTAMRDVDKAVKIDAYKYGGRIVKKYNDGTYKIRIDHLPVPGAGRETFFYAERSQLADPSARVPSKYKNRRKLLHSTLKPTAPLQELANLISEQSAPVS